MRLALYKSLWGVVRTDRGTKLLSEVLPLLRGEGYDGVECSVKQAYSMNEAGEFVALMKEHGLRWVPIIFSSGPMWGGWDPFLPSDLKSSHQPDVAQHISALQGQIDSAKRLGLDIAFFNGHTGHDSFPLEEAVALFKRCQELETAVGIPIIHEIHRGRITYSPWVTSRVLKQVPSLRLIADYSHWTCVLEAYVGDPELAKVIQEMLPHIAHIHARIGYENGPQIHDPRAPSSKPWLEEYKGWWSEIWRYQHCTGVQVSSMTPEGGPPTYQQTHPFDDSPVADIEEVNTWVAAKAREWFEEVQDSLRTPERGDDHAGLKA